jgi:abortive infection bacteriophage resistance protein
MRQEHQRSAVVKHFTETEDSSKLNQIEAIANICNYHSCIIGEATEIVKTPTTSRQIQTKQRLAAPAILQPFFLTISSLAIG